MSFRLSTCFFLLCVGCFFLSCIRSKEERYAEVISRYKELPSDKRNEKLCRLLNRPHYMDSDTIRALIDAGADPNCNCTLHHSTQSIFDLFLGRSGGHYTEETTPVELCFEKDSVALLDFMVMHGGKLDSIDMAHTSDIRMWTYLFEKGLTKKNFSFLPKNAVTDTVHIQFLLDHGFTVNEALDSNGISLLMVCLEDKQDNDTSLLHYLVKKGADFSYGQKRSSHYSSYTPPVFFTTKAGQKDLFFFMIRHGVSYKGCYYDNRTVMQDLIYHSKNDSCYDQVKMLIDSGLSVNERYDTELPALSYAIKGDNPKILSLLLDKGAEWKQYTTWSGFRHDEPDPFEVCLDECAVECLKLLLERYPKKADKKKLIQQLERDIQEHPQFAGSDPQCTKCLEVLKAAKN